MDIVNCECTITPKVFCKSKILNSRYLKPKTVMQHVQIVERSLSQIPEQYLAIVLTKISCYVSACIFDQCPSYCLTSGFQMSSVLLPEGKHEIKRQLYSEPFILREKQLLLSTLRPYQFDLLIHEQSSEKKLVGRSKYTHICNYESHYKSHKLTTTQKHYVRIQSA